ncbi:MAG: DUF1257 domain-containing protein [Verrucomicrobia bacterium]|nr:DUF1257 domain-containing protein [Verrucomicrobiota bacterium]
MSHFTSIQTQIRDVSALQLACQELGVELSENAEARGYGSNRRKGDLIIRLKGPYDIAGTRNADGSYELITDWWGKHVEREVGKGYGKLLQLYGVYKAQAEAKRKGYTTRRRSLKDGSIKITIGGLR